MNNLLYLLSGWFGVFTRGSVLIQLVVLAAVMLLYRSSLLRLRLPRSSWKRLAMLGVPIVVLQLFAVLLSSYGQPEGLVLLAVNLLLIWAGLTALRLLLRRFQPVQEVEGYWRRAVVPFFLVLALAAFVDSIEGLQMISAIPLLQMFGHTFTMGSLFMLVLLPYFLVVLSELPVFLAGEALARLADMDPGNRKAFELLLRYGLIGIGLLWLANQIGLDSTAVAAIAGGLSVGLGFGIKEVFSNFISGIWLLFEGSVRPGDILVYEGDACEVRRLGLRAATLWRDGDNAELVVPNQNFFTATTINYSGADSLRRSNVVLSVHYRHEPELVVQLILESVAKVPRALKTPPPIARICNYSESSIHYMVLYWIDAPMDNGSIAGEVRRSVWHTFHEQGIEFPYPQRVVHPAQSMPGDQQG